MSERQLNDQRARDTIATDLDTNLMVLAGAGSGKTHVLVERMVACIASGPTEVENLAAITFTRKAAGEMRGRFTLRLRDAVDGARGDEAARLRHAVDRVDGCFIGTIHAFCARLLRERPVEAGVPPEFVEVEEREEIPLRRQAWDRFIQHRYADGDRLLLELEEIDIRPEDLYAAFSERCRFGELVLKPSPPIFLDLAGPVSEVLAFIERGEAQIPDPLPGRRDTFMAALGRARDFISHRGLDTDRERVALLDLLDSSAGITLKGWHPNEAFARDLRDNVWPHFRETVIRPAITQVRQHICHSAGGLLDEAMRFYEGLRLEWGRLTFHDLLMRAAALLRDHSHVRRYFQQRYRCLFVDEFQDTDPIQAEVLLYLTGSDLREPDWRRLEPVPGSLFIVGDEKQSIYRFRRADVQTLHLVRDRLLQSGGRTVELTTSFRSLGNLCRWTNDTFAPLFAQSSPPHQAEFSPLLHHRPVGPDPCGVRRISNPKVPGNRRHDIAAHDAERIVDFIAAAITGQTGFNGSSPDAILQDRASPGDFMILTRTTGGLHHYARALEERRIPFDIVGGGRLGESDELRALVEMVEAVYAPDNPIPLLGYLRGPLVGLGDDELYALRRTGGSFNHRTALPDGLPDPLRDRLDAAYSRLRRAARWLRTVAPATAFEHILDDLGLLPFSLARHNGSSKAGNLVRVLSLVRHWECGGMHWGQIVAELRDLIDDGDYRIEEMTLEAGQEDVVRLMNLHQAKGLQARVVFLADPYDTAAERHDVAFHVSRTTEPPCLSMPIRKPRGPYARRIVAEPAGWAEDAEKEGRFGQAEERRLLYVAATRAENLLVVSTYEGNRKCRSCPYVHGLRPRSLGARFPTGHDRPRSVRNAGVLSGSPPTPSGPSRAKIRRP